MRLRLKSSVVQVVHDGPANDSKGVVVTYHNAGRLYRVRAKAFVSSMGGWVNKHVVGIFPPSP